MILHLSHTDISEVKSSLFVKESCGENSRHVKYRMVSWSLILACLLSVMLSSCICLFWWFQGPFCCSPRKSWPKWHRLSREKSHMLAAEILRHSRYCFCRKENIKPASLRCTTSFPVSVYPSGGDPNQTNQHLNLTIHSSWSSGSPWMNPADPSTAESPPAALNPPWAC